MKLYEHPGFPNPRRVRIFLAEKGLQVQTETIDLPAGQHRTPEYLSKNPSGLIPALETDSGEVISESASICRYIEETQPEPALMGETALEKGYIDMWDRRMENQLFNPLGSYFHHSTAGLGDERYRNSEWGDHNRDLATKELTALNQRLKNQPFISGNQFSVADITALCAIDVGLALEAFTLDGLDDLSKWHANVSARPSAAA